MDNDLPVTDNCPGFGSVAKYIAVSVREASFDVRSMAKTSTRVFVLEVMGRHAGWIAAAGGLASDPETQLKGAVLIIFFIGGINIILGLVAFIFRVESLYAMGLGQASIITGVVFVGLGRLVRLRSSVALLAAIVMLVVDGVVAMTLPASQGLSPSVGGALARLFLILPMVQGFGAIRALKGP